MPQTSYRTSTFTESVIRRMTRVANQTRRDQSFPGLPGFRSAGGPAEGRGADRARGAAPVCRHLGSAGFSRALAKKQSRFMGLPLDADANFVVTCGSTEAMMVAMMTACNPGDKVIVFSPFYENYAADAILSGAEPIYVPLHPPEFSFDPAELRRAFEQRPKALVLCNPSNPSGKVFTREELLYIASLAEEFDTFVLTDEVYEHIVYAPHRHTYFAALPGMFERTISCSSLSKTYSITGWRLGYVIAPPAIVNEARKVHDFLTVGAAAPLQAAAVTALELPDSYYAELLAEYTRKARPVSRLSRSGGAELQPSAGRILCDGRYLRVRLEGRC